MSTPGMREQLLERYPCLGPGSAGRLDRILEQAALASMPAEQCIFEEGEPCRGFPFVLEGSIRIMHNSRSGRSIELYRVDPGEICLLSTSALISQGQLPARGVTAAPTRLLLLPPPAFEPLLADAAFRHFVFGTFGQRMAELMSVVHALAFQSLEQRLAGLLLGHGRRVRLTHQAIADELGAVRESVTRTLNRLESQGLIRLTRECIEIIDGQALRLIASDETHSA